MDGTLKSITDLHLFTLETFNKLNNKPIFIEFLFNYYRILDCFPNDTQK